MIEEPKSPAPISPRRRRRDLGEGRFKSSENLIRSKNVYEVSHGLSSQNSTEQLLFGKEGIRWTIGSSRKDNDVIPVSPGPAAYDISQSQPSSPRFTIKARQDVDYSTPTSKVDMPDVRIFPRKLEKHIGVRKSTQYWRNSDTPLFLADPPTSISKPKIHIATRHPDAPNNNPGPGEYSPTVKYSPKLTTIPKARDIIKPRASSPGPGAYNINRSLIGTEKWKGSIRPIKKYLYTDE